VGVLLLFWIGPLIAAEKELISLDADWNFVVQFVMGDQLPQRVGTDSEGNLDLMFAALFGADRIVDRDDMAVGQEDWRTAESEPARHIVLGKLQFTRRDVYIAVEVRQPANHTLPQGRLGLLSDSWPAFGIVPWKSKHGDGLRKAVIQLRSRS